MADVKFSDDERDAVVRSLEKLRGIKMTRIGSKKKFFKGTDNLHYCIIGGRDDWHEIPGEVMGQEKENSKSVFLVIARWLKTKIEVYGGLLKPVFDSRALLSQTVDGDFHLQLKTPEDGAISIKQVPGAKFPKINEFPPPSISKFRSLSKEQQRLLLKKAGIE